MKRSFFVICLSLVGFGAFSQYNPEKPDLMQGKFYTEEQAVKVHEDLAKQYTDKKSWEKHAALIRQGILEGSELNKLKLKKPSNPKT